MPRNARQRHRRRTGNLFLTPLIDMIFLLVLFFILNTSFREDTTLDVTLPSAESAEETETEGLVLTLRADGSLVLNDVETSWESLVVAIRRKADEMGVREVLFRADEQVSYGRAVAAMDRIRLAGLEAIALQTKRELP